MKDERRLISTTDSTSACLNSLEYFYVNAKVIHLPGHWGKDKSTPNKLTGFSTAELYLTVRLDLGTLLDLN